MNASTHKDRTMKLSTLVISCALALGGTAFAQSDKSAGSSASGSEAKGPSLVDKAKTGVHKLGDATRKVANKVTGKDKKSGDPTDTSKLGGSNDESSSIDSGSQGKKPQKH
jgi:hypothetical protein